MMDKSTAAVASCRYIHPRLGAVRVKVNGSTRAIRARWVGPVVQITVPPNLPLREYDDFINKFGDRILAGRPERLLSVGSTVDAWDVDFSFVYSNDLPARYNWAPYVETSNPVRGKLCNYVIRINPRFMPPERAESSQGVEWLNSLLLHMASKATADYILPVARAHAADLHLLPMGWMVKESKTRLGCCDSKGIITLSPRLIFMPHELRDYIIFHELAHLSEMNHSQAFHELCNRYCDGREKVLEARVKSFKFPVF